MPWNYELKINKDRNYPLVIFLHGGGGAGNISYLNYLGYDSHKDSSVDSTALNFQKEHPCYVLIPQTDSYWDNNSLIEHVENFKKAHRVDTNRIYLIGYSMGGSGSYSFANSYYDFNGQLFASIIRLAGQSQTEVRGKIAEQTAIWIHIGLNDTEKRVQVTRDAYKYFKNLYPEASETTSVVQIKGYDGVTYSLNINGFDRFKRTEYENVGHGVVAFPFKDPYLIKWLFNHKIN
jgi:predicted peptidase